MRKAWLIAVGLAVAWFAMGPPVGAADKKAEKKEPAKKASAPAKSTAKKAAPAKGGAVALKEPVVVKLDDLPAFGKDEGDRIRTPRGTSVRCMTQPSSLVKAYPKLKSAKPLYGVLTVDPDPTNPTAGKKFHFVLDESGDPPAKKSGEGKAAEDVPSPMANLKYDRLYFDSNADLDLTNDAAVKIAAKSPYPGLAEAVLGRVFEDVAVSVDCGEGVGKRPFSIVPRLRGYSAENAYIDFLPKNARKGKFRLGGQEYIVWLSQSRMLAGRYDRPFVELEIRSAKEPGSPVPFGSGALGEMRLIEGTLAAATASPLGDKLTLGPYRGEMGALEIGPGGRTVTELGIVGRLASRTLGVPLGESFPAPETLPRRHMVPVGDYQAVTLTAQCGRLRFDSRMIPPSQSTKPAAQGIAIRKDKPCVLEFSGKPDVVFMNPAKDASFKPGSQVYIRAMLTEPWQGIQITGLWDTTQKKGTSQYRIGGKEVRVTEYARLDPTIIIRNSAGEQVAEGKMPFG